MKPFSLSRKFREYKVVFISPFTFFGPRANKPASTGESFSSESQKFASEEDDVRPASAHACRPLEHMLEFLAMKRNVITLAKTVNR
jgi:hypothetical protein